MLRISPPTVPQQRSFVRRVETEATVRENIFVALNSDLHDHFQLGFVFNPSDGRDCRCSENDKTARFGRY
jgi:hypothetical protein